MKLQPDCIRAILFNAEEQSTGFTLISWDCTRGIGDFNCEVFKYHLLYCVRAGLFVDGKFLGNTNTFVFTDISVSAHEFIANIRENSNWKKIKEVSSKIGSNAVNVLQEIAKTIILAKVSSII